MTGRRTFLITGVNLASSKQADAVNRLARLTGTMSIPALKQQMNYFNESKEV